MAVSTERPEETDVDDLVGDSPLRGQRAGSVDRRSRDLEPSREAEDRGLIDDEDEKFALFAQTLFNDVLPAIPPIPGFHVCWLSTTHNSDTIPSRIRLGYSPIKPSEIPGFEHAALTTGEYAGFVGIKEMVAFKIPETLYQRFMHQAHNVEPQRQLEGIQSQLDSLKGQAERDGGKILEGDGMEELRRSAPSRVRFE